MIRMKSSHPYPQPRRRHARPIPTIAGLAARTHAILATLYQLIGLTLGPLCLFLLVCATLADDSPYSLIAAVQALPQRTLSPTFITLLLLAVLVVSYSGLCLGLLGSHQLRFLHHPLFVVAGIAVFGAGWRVGTPMMGALLLALVPCIAYFWRRAKSHSIAFNSVLLIALIAALHYACTFPLLLGTSSGGWLVTLTAGAAWLWTMFAFVFLVNLYLAWWHTRHGQPSDA